MESPVFRRDADFIATIAQVVKRHWILPAVSRPVQPISGLMADELSRTVLDVLLTRQYRVGPLPETAVYQELLARVRYFVARGKPITITLGYGPQKNQNTVTYSRADWAEFFALGHLVSWHNKVQKIYPPGLTIQIVFDDGTLLMANHAKKAVMRSYMTSITDLIQALGYESIFPRPLANSQFAWLFRFGLYQLAEWRVRRWENQSCHQALIERMDAAAARNLTIPPLLTPERQALFVRDASHKYRVFWEALQILGITRSKKRIIAMYLDGSQHHIQQTIAFHLTTLGKGNVTQPWQGEGVLMNNGHGTWEPCVLTAGRRQRSRTWTLNGLELVPYHGFDQITLAESLQAKQADIPPDRLVNSQLATTGALELTPK
jgi:hypothetical protein